MIPDRAFIAGLAVVAIAGFACGGIAGWQSRGQSDKEAGQPVSLDHRRINLSKTCDGEPIHAGGNYTLGNDACLHEEPEPPLMPVTPITTGSVTPGSCGNGTASWTCAPPDVGRGIGVNQRMETVLGTPGTPDMSMPDPAGTASIHPVASSENLIVGTVTGSVHAAGLVAGYDELWNATGSYALWKDIQVDIEGRVICSPETAK